MTVQSGAITHNTLPPNWSLKISEKDGKITNNTLNMLQQFHDRINGLCPTVACNSTNVGNVYTLTPLNISPVVPQYYSFWSFAFVASATSTGLVTATVVPQTGSLPTLPVYKNHGAAQATAGDLTINLFYVMYYVDTLNAGNGGFVLIG